MKPLGFKSIAVNASHLAATRIFTQTIRAIYIIVLARYFGPEVFGLFAYGQSWYMAFLPLTAIGLGVIVSREVGWSKELGADVVIKALELRVVLSLGAAVACGIGSWIFEAEHFARQLLMIFSLALAGRGVAIWSEQVFVAYETSRYAFQQEIIFRPIEVIIGLTILGTGGGILAVALSHALIWWFQAIRGLHLVHRHLTIIHLDWELQGLLRLFKRGIPICLSALFSGWLLQGPLVLYRFFGEGHENLGELALTLQAFVLMCALPWSIGMASLPVLSRAASREDGKDIQFVEGMLRVSFLLGAVAGIIGLGFGPLIVPFLFGEAYVQAGVLLGPAMWLLIPLTAANSLTQALNARGFFVRSAVSSLAGALVFTVMMPFAVLHLDTSGVFVSIAIGLTIQVIVLLLSMAPSMSVDFRLSILRPGISITLSMIVYLISKPLGVFSSVSMGLIFLFILGVFFRVITREELRTLTWFIQRTFLRRDVVK